MTVQLTRPPKPPVINNFNTLTVYLRALSNWLERIQLGITTDRTRYTDLFGISSGDINLTANMVFSQEDVTPSPDGTTTLFTVPYAYRTGQLWVYRDQSTLIRGIDFTETSNTTITLTVAPDSDESLKVSGVKAV